MKIKKDGSQKRRVCITAGLCMGLSHLLYFKQYWKGIFYLLLELLFLLYLPECMVKLYNLITLGSPQPGLPVKQRANSIFMLIDGVIVIVIIILFIAVYVGSIRDARKEYIRSCRGENCGESKRSLRQTIQEAFPILGLMPTIVLVVFLVIVPLVFSACAAFTNYSSPAHIPPNNTVDWVGLENVRTMFGGSAVWTQALGRVVIWTVLWAILATVTCFFGGLFIAVILEEYKFRFTKVLRVVFILPYAIPSVLSMLVWKNLLNGTFGTVNQTLMAIGIVDKPIAWLGNEWLAKFVCILVNLWAGFPYFMLLAMGTMTAISSELFDAARIDGANRFQLFRRITFPLVLYQTMPLLIMSFTHNINNFGVVFFLTEGGPVVANTTSTNAGGTDLLITWIYKLTVNMMRYNYASVLAVMIFLVLAPIAIYNFRKTKSYKEGEL